MITGTRGQLNRYSEAFKRDIIEQIERNDLTPAEAVRKYGIGHCSTINYWMKRYGKRHLVKSIVRIAMPQEPKDQELIKQLKAEKQQLESALAQSQLKVIAMESLIEAAEEEFQIDIKKKSGPKPLQKPPSGSTN